MSTKEKVKNEQFNHEETAKPKNSSVTMKTLKAWLEMTRRICDDYELTSTNDALELNKIAEQVKEKFITNKF